MNKSLELIKRIVPRALRQRAKRQLEDYFDVPTVERSLEHMRELGFRPSYAVDVGAYKGEWTVQMHKIFPHTSFLMLEAQEGQRRDLEAVKQKLGSSADYRIALLGAENRESAVFHELPGAPTGSSVLSYRPGGSVREIRCRMQSLDTVLTEAGMPNPDLMKLDVQGYELEVLKGAPNALKSVSAIVMEVSLLELYEDNPLLQDVLSFMLRSNFVPYDIGALLRRPADGLLAQIDMIFVSSDSPLGRKQRQTSKRTDASI